MNKKNPEPTYESVKNRLSDEEIIDSYVFRSTMTAAEKEEADAAFRKLRFEQLKNMSDKQILQGELMRMRLLMKDYFEQSTFMKSFSFSVQLKTYIELLKKSQASFAKDIDIHKTKLSRLLNDKENPNIDLMYRLEWHSGQMIPATYWFKLHTKKLEHSIKENQEKRKEASKRVKNELNFEESF